MQAAIFSYEASSTDDFQRYEFGGRSFWAKKDEL
jgi:hypothetical protein